MGRRSPKQEGFTLKSQIPNLKSPSDLAFDPGPVFQAFTTGKGATAEDARCRVHTLPFESAHTGFLLPEDRCIEENRRFTYVMMEPAGAVSRRYGDALLITHGLNEGNYTKLFPWAYNLAFRLQIPVLIFPMAFHINRRSDAWGFSPQVHLANARAQTPDNRKTSPFNAQISARIATAPERFYRGGLQTYHDLIDLSDRIRSGGHPACRPGARLHFLGYSAGGYVALVLMLANAGGRFDDSRCIVFASGAPLEHMHAASIFIVDTEANARLHAFLSTRAYECLPFEPRLAASAEAPARWLTAVLFTGPSLSDRLAELKDRIFPIAGAGDIVITPEGMRANLHPLTVRTLPLGIHEFPFTIAGPLSETYDRRQAATRTLIKTVKQGQYIAPAYQTPFTAFVDMIASFLRISS